MSKNADENRVRNPFTRRERDFLLSLSKYTKEQNLLGGFQRKVLYDAGYYNSVFLNRLSKVNNVLSELEEHLSSSDAEYASDIRDKGYRLFLQRTAEQGHPESQYYLGDGLRYGLYGFDEDDIQAITWFEKSAEGGNVDAMRALAGILLEGIIVDRNEARALALLKSALKLGEYQAGHDLAVYFIEGEEKTKDIKKGLKYLRLAAREAVSDAQVMLGNLHYWGEHVRKSAKRALGWYQKAADQDHYYGMVCLGTLYEDGEGTEKDDVRAFELYQTGSLGSAWGDFHIGRCKQFGIGCEVDHKGAFEAYEAALEYGVDQAHLKLARCYISGEGVAQDYGKAKVHLDEAVEADDTDPAAHFWLGRLKSGGFGCLEDKAAALGHFLKVVENDDSDVAAKREIGEAFYFGHGVETNYEEAVRWLKLAAEEQDARALYVLGECHYSGDGVIENEIQAVQLFKSAVEHGDEDAAARLIELGYDVPKKTASKENIHFLNNDLLATSRMLYQRMSNAGYDPLRELNENKTIDFQARRQSKVEALMAEVDVDGEN